MRLLSDWNFKDLARTSGCSPSLLSRAWRGDRAVPPKATEALVSPWLTQHGLSLPELGGESLPPTRITWWAENAFEAIVHPRTPPSAAKPRAVTIIDKLVLRALPRADVAHRLDELLRCRRLIVESPDGRSIALDVRPVHRLAWFWKARYHQAVAIEHRGRTVCTIAIGHGHLRLELNGGAFATNTAESIAERVLARLVLSASVRIHEVHVAVDADVPFRELLVTLDADQVPVRSERAFIDARSYRASGVEHGRRTAPQSSAAYDKLAHHSSEGAALPGHFGSFHLGGARFELRARPQADADVNDILDNMEAHAAAFIIADLRYREVCDLDTVLLVLAKRCGIGVRPPTLRGLRKKSVSKNWARAMLTFPETILRDLDRTVPDRAKVPERIAERAVAELHAALREELERLAHDCAVDVAAAFASDRTRVAADLGVDAHGVRWGFVQAA